MGEAFLEECGEGSTVVLELCFVNIRIRFLALLWVQQLPSVWAGRKTQKQQ